jgi:hypothetical protein
MTSIIQHWQLFITQQELIMSEWLQWRLCCDRLVKKLCHVQQLWQAALVVITYNDAICSGSPSGGPKRAGPYRQICIQPYMSPITPFTLIWPAVLGGTRPGRKASFRGIQLAPIQDIKSVGMADVAKCHRPKSQARSEYLPPDVPVKRQSPAAGHGYPTKGIA